MPIPLPEYAQIKNNYCISYAGACGDFVAQLIYLHPFISQTFPELKISLSFNSRFCGAGHIPIDQLEAKKRGFAYIKQIKCNMTDHPIWELIKEADLQNKSIKPQPHAYPTKRCVVCPNGVLPSKSLDTNQTNTLCTFLRNKGYQVEVSENLDGAGWVVGVESLTLYQALFQGIKTTLVPTGIGKNVYNYFVGNNEPLPQLEKILNLNSR